MATLGLLICLARAVPALAHDPGLSALELRLEAVALAAHLTFSWLDVARLVPLDADRDGSLSPAELQAARPALEALARRALDLRLDGRRLGAGEARVELDESAGLHFHVLFSVAVPARAGGRIPPVEGDLVARSALLAELPRGHRQYAALRTADGLPAVERLLTAGAASFHAGPAELAGAGGAESPRSFRQFLVLGVEHILTGYDHLAFLLALLVAGGTLRSAAKIITSFTAAHSLTLALATLDVVRVPPSVVEPLIAASIVYVGLENLLRRDPPRRWMLTFGFGLVHGFGFASVLRELGIGGRGADAAVPLLSFNAGVELGQLAIALLTLPLVWSLGRRPAYAARAVTACSAAVTLLGAWWLIHRTLLG